MLSVETVLNMLSMQEGDKHSSELYMSTSSLAAPEAYSPASEGSVLLGYGTNSRMGQAQPTPAQQATSDTALIALHCRVGGRNQHLQGTM